MRPHHTQTSDMTMLQSIRRLLLHLRQNIPHHLRILAGDITRHAGPGTTALITILGPDDGDEAQLGPCQGVVEVVFQKVVFGEVGDVAGLDGGEEVDVGGVGGEGDDVDHFGLGGGGARASEVGFGWCLRGAGDWMFELRKSLEAILIWFRCCDGPRDIWSCDWGGAGPGGCIELGILLTSVDLSVL